MPDKQYTENTKRLARNAAMLYVRQLAIMLINFFTTRELLGALGGIDFGLANVIGGVVTMFSFLSGMLSTSSSRYFNFELGRGDFKSLKETFNTSLQIYAALILLLVILCETVGLWTFQTKLEIPPQRYAAACVFFHFTVATFIFNIAAIPFLSLVISHENMKVFSGLSIFEALGKLSIIYLLFTDKFDRLSAYGALLFAVSLIHFLSYAAICLTKYPESRICLYFSAKRFKEIVFFSAWNLWGASANLFSNILVNVLLNNFFGAALNTARAVAVQVSGALTTFSNNFLTAVRPQIVKYWASGDSQQSYNLVYQSSKFGYLFVLFLSLPILLEPKFALKIWLGELPPYADLFLQFALLQVLVSIISHPLITLAQASGKIALYQTVVGLTYWFTFPLVYIAFKLGASPVAAMIIAVLVESIALVLRIILTHRCSKIPLFEFVKNAIFPSLKVTIAAPVIPLAAKLTFQQSGVFEFIVICLLSAIFTLLSIYVLVLTNENKISIKSKLLGALSKIRESRY